MSLYIYFYETVYQKYQLHHLYRVIKSINYTLNANYTVTPKRLIIILNLYKQ